MESDRLDGHYLREIKGGAESQKFYAIPVPDDCETKIKLHMAYWVKWGYSDEEVIALIKFLNEITPIKSLLLHYEEGGSLEYGEYIYSAGTLSCRELPVSHYPDATDSDSDQEHLQQAFERYGTTRLIPFS